MSKAEGKGHKAEGKRQKAVPWSLRALCLLPSAFCLVSACAPKPPLLPTGSGAPFPDYEAAFEQATAACRGVRTFTASMALSGKAGTMKLRGRIDGGFEAPARARLEGIAPFGRPVFVLVADGNRGTLVLPREDRVLRDALPDQIVEALAGVPLGPDALRTLLTGCGFPDGAPASGAIVNQYQNEWLTLTFPGGTTYLVKRGGAWHLVAAKRGPVTVNYSSDDSGRPEVVDIRAVTEGRVTADLRLRLSEVEINTTLDPKTFQAELPEHPVPLTLDELRRAGPLGGG